MPFLAKLFGGDNSREQCWIGNGGILLQKLISNSQGRSNPIRIFTRRDLEEATNNYHPSRLVSEYASRVYRGVVDGGREVAVIVTDDPFHEDPTDEVAVLSSISHRNVVQLLGCCLETKVPILVFEFVHSRRLCCYIYGGNHRGCHCINRRSRESTLSWPLRLKVAMDVAEGLCYLHYHASQPIIHRDVKPSKILLLGGEEEDYTIAKIGFFNLSLVIPRGESEIDTKVVGTISYVDPVYLKTGTITEKADVYAFGVVLLQMLTGYPPHMWHETGHEFPAEAWYRFRRTYRGVFDGLANRVGDDCSSEGETEEQLQESLMKLMEDPVMRGAKIEEWLLNILADGSAIRGAEGKKEQLLAVAELAWHCVQIEVHQRPDMKEVVKEIRRIRKL